MVDVASDIKKMKLKYTVKNKDCTRCIFLEIKKLIAQK